MYDLQSSNENAQFILFSFDKEKAKDGEMHETYHIGCNHCFSLYDSDFVLVQIDMRHFIGYTIRNIA